MMTFKKNWRLKKKAINLNSRPNSDTPLELEGQRIILRPSQLSDYPRWKKVRTRNQKFLKPYEPQWAENALSEDFFKRRLELQTQEMNAGRGAFFLIHHKDSHDIIGGVNLNNIQYGAACSASLGYWLDEGSQGFGYMHEATGLVMDYAFNILKLYRLNAACLPDNDRSIKMLLRHGFEEEGYAKNYLQINGMFQDHRLFGKIN